MQISLSSLATNIIEPISYPEHPFIRNSRGVEALFIPYDPKCWALQSSPTISNNRLKNLGYAPSSLYLGSEPVNGVANITAAPSFDNGRLLFNTSENDAGIQSKGSNADFSISNQAKLIITWIKPTALTTEEFCIASKHVGDLNANFGLVARNGKIAFYWVWNAEAIYTATERTSPLIQNNQLLQLSVAFEPNGADSTVKYFVNGAQIAIDSYIGKNAFNYHSNTPPLILGRRNAGESAQGYLYEFAMENLNISRNDAAFRVLENYQEMQPFYASLG